jgi:sortase A
MKFLRATGSVFIFLGLSILFFVLYELVGTSAITKGHQSALQREFTQQLAAPGSLGPEFTDGLGLGRQKGGAVRALARLKIPSISVNVIVVEGVTLDDLTYGPGHYPQTDLFDDESGVVGVAGHRTGWSAPFFNFDKLARGDEVIVETTQATYTYRVMDSIIVSPSHSEVLDGNPRSTAKMQLVLTTCTPKFTARDRLIIFTDLVKTVARTT